MITPKKLDTLITAIVQNSFLVLLILKINHAFQRLFKLHESMAESPGEWQSSSEQLKRFF